MTAHFNICLQYLSESSAVAAQQSIVKPNCCAKPLKMYGFMSTFTHYRPNRSGARYPKDTLQ
eukprot:793880-Pelagomonas_calceolata.AAC.1